LPKKTVRSPIRALAALEEYSFADAGRLPAGQPSWRQIFPEVRELYKKDGGKFPIPS